MEGAAAGGRNMRPGEQLEGAPTVGSGVGRAEMLLTESDLRDGRHSQGRGKARRAWGFWRREITGVAGGLVGAGGRDGREAGAAASHWRVWTFSQKQGSSMVRG